MFIRCRPHFQHLENNLFVLPLPSKDVKLLFLIFSTSSRERQEPVEEESPAENVQPDTESGQENVQEPAPEPARWNISTGGNWEPLENYLTEQLEVGKTYHIKVQGKCEFMIAKDKPTAGIATNEITFTKQNDVTIWIKTGV